VQLQISTLPCYPFRISFQNILTALFVLVSILLITRFAVNIFRIFRKIHLSKKVHNLNTTIVLIKDKTLPYSFFKYIFITQLDFESGKIEPELILHEEAHCEKYHSIDILIIEIINIFFWFNPAIWLIRKEILLNHEYSADNKVMMLKDPINYQKLLLNILLQNNLNYLVSNFKYSFMKKRLNMMNKNTPLHSAILRKILSISLFLILVITLTFSQEIKKPDYMLMYKQSWWYPILKLHNIEPRAFNTFDPVFEMGTTNSIDGRIVTLENAFFLIKSENDHYTIIRTALAYHDLDKNIIHGDKRVTIEVYKCDSEDTKPLETYTSVGFEYKLADKK